MLFERWFENASFPSFPFWLRHWNLEGRALLFALVFSLAYKFTCISRLFSTPERSGNKSLLKSLGLRKEQWERRGEEETYSSPFYRNRKIGVFEKELRNPNLHSFFVEWK